MSSAVVLRRGHVELEKNTYYERNDRYPIPSSYVMERVSKKKKTPLIICVHHTGCNSCGCVGSKARQLMIDSSHGTSHHADEWQQLSYYHDPYATRYGNEVMVVPAHSRSYATEPPRVPQIAYYPTRDSGATVYQPQVYFDSAGRPYTADVYGRTRWL